MKTIKLKKASDKVATFQSKKKALTIANLFTDDNAETGICAKEEMENYISNLDENEFTSFKFLFENLFIKARINISPKIYTDRFGVDFVYVNINYVNSGGGEKFKVICFPGFEKFRTALKTSGVYVQLQEILDYLEINIEDSKDDENSNDEEAA